MKFFKKRIEKTLELKEFQLWANFQNYESLIGKSIKKENQFTASMKKI